MNILQQDAPPRVKTDDKSKLFGGPRSSFFMAFNRTRDPGQINHAYQPDESDDDRESEGSDPECNSSSMGTEDNDSNIYSAGSLNGSVNIQDYFLTLYQTTKFKTGPN